MEWVLEVLYEIIRYNETNKKVVPIITCNPWNPVAIKKVDPYDASAIENSAWIYSIAWSREKYNPKKQVSPSIRLAFFKLFEIIKWWDHVTVTPDLTKMIVLRSGTFIGLKVLMRGGGQDCPISNIGLILEWK